MKASLIRYNQLILLILLFCLPVGCAWYYLHMVPRTNLTFNNHGELRQWQNKLFPVVNDGLWKIVYFKPEKCTADCQNVMNDLQKLQTALGVNAERTTIISATSDQLEHAAGAISIVDPQGIEVLYYVPGMNLHNVLHDLKRLLKYSHALKK